MNNETGPHFYVNRADGFGTRIITIINAISLAEYFDGKLIFSWRELLRSGILHSVPEKSAVFSEEFVKKYFSPLKKAKTGKSLVSVEEFIGLEPDAKKKLVDDGKSLIEVEHRLPDCWIELIGEEKNKDLLKSSFSKIEFNAELSTVVRRANSVEIDDSTVALQLRAGDVIYGKGKYIRAVGTKAVPYQLAWQYLEDCRANGAKAILFGQDEELCRALARQSNAIFCEELIDKNWNAFQRELFEIILISRCSRAVGGESAFLRLAAAVGGKVPETIYEIYPSDKRRDIILNADIPESVQQAAANEQKLYSLWMVVVEILEDENSDIDQLLSITEKALSYIPTDAFMGLCRACILLKSGDFADGEALIIKVAEVDDEKLLIKFARMTGTAKEKLIAFLDEAVAKAMPWSSALQALFLGFESEKMSDVGRLALSDAGVSASLWGRRIREIIEENIVKSAEDAAQANLSITKIQTVPVSSGAHSEA